MNLPRLLMVAVAVMMAILVIGLVMARMPHRSRDQQILIEKSRH